LSIGNKLPFEVVKIEFEVHPEFFFWIQVQRQQLEKPVSYEIAGSPEFIQQFILFLAVHLFGIRSEPLQG